MGLLSEVIVPIFIQLYSRVLKNFITRPKIRSCWKQDATMLLGQHCSLLSTILFGIVTPDCGLIQAQQYCSILLTTRNNVAPTILLHPVFNNLLQLIIFCRVPFSGVTSVDNRRGEYSCNVFCLINFFWSLLFLRYLNANIWIFALQLSTLATPLWPLSSLRYILPWTSPKRGPPSSKFRMLTIVSGFVGKSKEGRDGRFYSTSCGDNWKQITAQW